MYRGRVYERVLEMLRGASLKLAVDKNIVFDINLEDFD
jgi:hypothetical protein